MYRAKPSGGAAWPARPEVKTATTILVFCVCAMLALGVVMLYSVTMSRYGMKFFGTQLIWCVVGLIACVVAASVNYHRYRKLVWPFYAVAVILLALVLVPSIGTERNGARRWFDFGFASFQPSELAKLIMIFVVAHYADQHLPRMRAFIRGLVIPGLIIALPVGLIFVEADRGAAIILTAVTGGMLIVAGVKWRYIIPPGVILSVALGFALMNDPVRGPRVRSWLNPEEYKETTAYQSWQSILAFGNGGWRGLGLGDSRQKLGFVPENHTDFILPIIGEELGLAGSLSVVIAYMAIICSGLHIARGAADTFRMLLATGVTFLIGLQAMVNIGVVTGALPNKGLPLPFISYGGSNLLLMLTAVGVLLSVARTAGEIAPEKNPFHSRRVLSPVMD